ncbi:MAG: MBL fold metallo-hydrolase [Bacillota bacterium]|nr:MBL fold metallo-hydrolase [Bacillota bacterium]
MIAITPLASGSKGNCYHITDGSTPLLLECGIPFKEIQRGLDFMTSEIKGCLISHEHGDHAKGAKDIMKAGIEIIASRGTCKALSIEGHRVSWAVPKLQFTIGTWAILPFETQHDAAEPLGFLLANKAGDKLLFATDTYYVKYKFTGLTHLLIECNYAADILSANLESGAVPVSLKNRLLKSHFSLDNVKDFLKANDLSKLEEIWLIHLSDGNSDAERFKREIQELTGKVVMIA